MTQKTMLMGAVAVVICGWMAAWLVWNRDVEVVEPVPPALAEQQAMQQQLNSLRGEMEGLKKEVVDLRKMVKIYKRQMLAAKGMVLNADQDIQKMVETALREEPVRLVGDDADLVRRARLLGLTTVAVE
jgi:hypothetical protein